MRIEINGHRGRVFHAAALPEFTACRPLYCFVPDQFLDKPHLNFTAYLLSRWPSINTGANRSAIGSHVFPDETRPVDEHFRCSILQEFLQGLPRYIAKADQNE